MNRTSPITGVNAIRQAYLDFFTQKPRDHTQIPSAPIVPINDPTTLFTPFGMQQMVPYLKGEPHPQGNRIVDSQPSIRIDDIDEVGDNRHTTFFEMLGNWSLGDYFKTEQLTWFFDFLTQIIHLDPHRLYASVFMGDHNAPQDKESIAIWQQLFSTNKPAQPSTQGFNPQTKIYLYDATKNWWSRAGTPENMPPGEIGGPDSEIFFDFDPDDQLQLHQRSPFRTSPCHVNCDCGRFLEIGNSVFMEFIKLPDGSFQPLPHQNVDFGGGLERIAAASLNNPDIFHIDTFQPLIAILESASVSKYQRDAQPPMRIIADHLRAATFIIHGGIEPSNKAQGYVLRRLLRRSVLKAKELNIADISATFGHIIEQISNYYQGFYLSNLDLKHTQLVVGQETSKFETTLKRGLKEFHKHTKITGKIAFDLLQTYGFPWELTLELATERGDTINKDEFTVEFNRHRELSRSASQGMFKGGLADHSDTIIRYHTATHLLHQALREILGPHVQQMGSNITSERLRFDFKHPAKLTDEEKQKIESLINQKIIQDLPVTKSIESKDQALNSGALAFFREKYPDQVSVYTIGHPNQPWYSKELCGGPHISSTGQIGTVTIKKEESVGTGVRRVYLVLDQ